jgi:hypothetical protein
MRGPDLESIVCPGCQKTIRVPAEVLGQRAQCPFCKCHFQAPVRTPDGLSEPVLMWRKVPWRRWTVLPATLMLMVGVIGFFNNAVFALQSQFDVKLFEENTRSFFEQLAERTEKEEERDAIRAKVPGAMRWRPTVSVASGLLSLVTIAGAIAVLRHSGYKLAMIASVVTMFNLANCCCFAGTFVGGYSLYVLMDPVVRAGFQKDKPAHG